MSFSAGQQNATLKVSTNDDDAVELSEYFKVMISSVDTPEDVEIGSSDTSVITIEDNEQGNLQSCDLALLTYVHP